MAVDLTTGSYDESGIFNKHSEVSKPVEKKQTEESFGSLKNFKVLRILKENSATKSIVVEGRFTGDVRPAIIVVEKMPFDTRDLPQLFSSDSRLELKFWNNIYGNYHVYPQNGFNGISVQVIHPATESDFLRFIDIPILMVKESKDLYENVILPHIRVISKKYEDITTIKSTDPRILYSESNEISAFVLLKDEPENCYCSNTHFRAKAVISQKDLLSLRDLTVSHLPLLIKLQNKCLDQLSYKYGIPAAKIEAFIVYPPSTFPFHVFFETIEKDCKIPAEQAHHLQTVICNLQMMSDYYKKVTLIYSVPEKDPLLKGINDHETDTIDEE
ncbi:hypothetical protein CDAR_619281 [Caerostris darwini]|uniref:m7GpppX diphosphatase n=1 Tax=Caerostris darwini TaxID=1538125 RepID=A0AAV4RXF4_9ARAC|nr:hypothetical protein CDAR_619281 [Caerostris darwini]